MSGMGAIFFMEFSWNFLSFGGMECDSCVRGWLEGERDGGEWRGGVEGRRGGG